jgi:hypothetical protein
MGAFCSLDTPSIEKGIQTFCAFEMLSQYWPAGLNKVGQITSINFLLLTQYDSDTNFNDNVYSSFYLGPNYFDSYHASVQDQLLSQYQIFGTMMNVKNIKRGTTDSDNTGEYYQAPPSFKNHLLTVGTPITVPGSYAFKGYSHSTPFNEGIINAALVNSQTITNYDTPAKNTFAYCNYSWNQWLALMFGGKTTLTLAVQNAVFESQGITGAAREAEWGKVPIVKSDIFGAWHINQGTQNSDWFYLLNARIGYINICWNV